MKILKNKSFNKTKAEFYWDDCDMNLFIIYNILHNLTYYDIPKFSYLEKDIQSLAKKIEFSLGLNDISGDLIKTQYIVTFES